MLGFGIENYFDGQKNDPRYIKWMVREYATNSDGEDISRYFPVRNCTAADFAKFYEPNTSSAKKVQDY